MEKEFNDTGLCVKNMHYMVDTSRQIEETFYSFIERGKYFTIDRSRQYGKTTTIALLTNFLQKKEDYFVIETSFEGIGDDIFKNQETFSKDFLMNIYYKYRLRNPKLADEFKSMSKQMRNFETLSEFITNFVQQKQKRIVLIIDEVDKASNYQTFLGFLGMLRDKYLNRNKGYDYTFQSVILAGVHDIKTLKQHIRPEEKKSFNSPWNIAVDFKIKLSFNAEQIVTMLDDYTSENPHISMPKKEISEKLYYFTSGYPWLVSKLCKFIDEDIITKRETKNWTIEDVVSAYRMITAPTYKTTLFDTIFKNMQGYNDLHETIKLIVIGGYSLGYDSYNKVITYGEIYGILREENGQCVIHNRIFEQRFYNYFLINTQIERLLKQPDYHSNFYTDAGRLNLEFILTRFQNFMKENYSYKDEKFIEREGRLLFLSFLKPIINGKGYDFKEPTVGEERRMDLAITFGDEKHVVELKIWRGARNHNKGLQQLSDYLDIYSLKKGYLLIYDFNENKEYKQENIKFKDKEIYAVYV